MATLGGRSTLDHTKACTSETDCEVLFGSVWVSPTSYSLYSSAISVAVQVRINWTNFRHKMFMGINHTLTKINNTGIHYYLFGCISRSFWLQQTVSVLLYIFMCLICTIVGCSTRPHALLCSKHSEHSRKCLLWCSIRFLYKLYS
jgi:hypothetical protein